MTEIQPEKEKLTESSQNELSNLERPSKRIQTNDDDIRTQYNGFTCSQCAKKIKQLFNLNKHIKNLHEEKKLKCNSSYVSFI